METELSIDGHWSLGLKAAISYWLLGTAKSIQFELPTAKGLGDKIFIPKILYFFLAPQILFFEEVNL